MSNFVDDNTTLPFPKTDARAVPVGQELKYVSAVEWNTLCQAGYDLRAAIRKNVSKIVVDAACDAVSLPTGLATIDGYQTVAGDRVLCFGLVSAPANGVYTVTAGTWTRSPDMSRPEDFPFASVPVMGGIVYSGRVFLCQNETNPTLGTTPITFKLWPLSGVSGDLIYYVDQATGSDSNNGSASYPFATIGKAVSLIPTNPIGYNFTIRIKAGIYAEDITIVTSQQLQGKYLIFEGQDWTTFTPSTGPASGTFTSSSSDHTLSMAGATWTSGELAGRFLKITSGTYNGKYIPIASNGAASVDVGCNVATIGLASFSFATPAAIVTGTNAKDVLNINVLSMVLGAQLPFVQFKNIFFDMAGLSGSNSPLVLGGSGGVYFEQCSIDQSTTGASYVLCDNAVSSNAPVFFTRSYARPKYTAFNTRYIACDGSVIEGGGTAVLGIQLLPAGSYINLRESIIQGFKGSGGVGLKAAA